MSLVQAFAQFFDQTFDQAAWLWLLPLSLLPLLPSIGGRSDALPNAWVAQLPRDGLSSALQWLLRCAATVAIAALAVGLSGPYRAEVEVERVGRGAEIVLVLDRSRSMDQGFAGARPAAGLTRMEALAYYSTLRTAEGRESKGQVARRMLSDFTAQRLGDRFAMVVFSTVPLRTLDFTQKQPAIQAAISAAGIGRGLADTHIALALESALTLFEGRPYTGSRILMLVSDGGDRLDVDARDRITELARKVRVGIYWIYIRSPLSPVLTPPAGAASATETTASIDAVPELFLHRYFQSLGVPYRAYEADNQEALRDAMNDVDRLENLPVTYRDTLPRRDLSGHAYAIAFAAVLLLLAANLAEIKRWG